MAWTLATYLDEALRAAELEDDLGDRFPVESLKRLFGVVHQAEWRALLDAAPLYRCTDQPLVITPDDLGRVTGAQLRSALELAVGANLVTPHRILRVARGSYLLDERPSLLVPFLPAPAADTGSSLDDGWRQISADASGIRGLQTLRTDGSPLSVWVNYLPAQVVETTPDETPVDWPAAHPYVLAYHMAGKLLTKGGVEEGAAVGQFRLADVERAVLRNALKDYQLGPLRMYPSDALSDWTLHGGF